MQWWQQGNTCTSKSVSSQYASNFFQNTPLRRLPVDTCDTKTTTAITHSITLLLCAQHAPAVALGAM